jgi:hypothetical protein
MRQLLRTFLTLTFFIGGFSALWAQPTQIWDKSYGGKNEDMPIKMLPLSDGNYLIAGHSNSPVSGNKSANTKGGIDYWIVKVKSDGTKIWDKSFGSRDNDFICDAIETSDRGILLAGYSYATTASGDKSTRIAGNWIIKLDANGRKLWDRSYPGISSIKVSEATDNGIHLFMRKPYGINEREAPSVAWLVKINSSGSQIWERQFTTPLLTDINYDFNNTYDRLGNGYLMSYPWGISCLTTPDGGILLGATALAGITAEKSQEKPGYYLLKLSAQGNPIWNKTYFNAATYTNSSDLGHFFYRVGLEGVLYSATDNCYYVYGTLHGGIGGGDQTAQPRPKIGNDLWVLKLDLSGNKLWDTTIEGSGNDVWFTNGNATSLAQGGIALTYNRWYSIIMISSTGTLAWNKNFLTASERAISIEPEIPFLSTCILELKDNHLWLGGLTSARVNRFLINKTAPYYGDESCIQNCPPDFWILDLEDPTTCPAVPNQVKITNIQATSATVTWQSLGNGFSYQLRYRVAGTNTWTETAIVNSPATSFPLAGLRSDVLYEVQVRSKCTTQPAFQAWEQNPIITFRTLANIQNCSARVPSAPNSILVQNITTLQATVQWQNIPDASGVVVVYGLANQSPNTWREVILCRPVNTLVLTPLQPNTKYRVRLRTLCNQCTTQQGNSKKSNWSPIVEFTTPGNGNKQASLETANPLTLNLYPNPNKGNFTIAFNSEKTDELHLAVFDVTGRLIYENNVPVQSGNNDLPFELKGISSGIYSLRVRLGAESQQIKLVIE